MTIRSLTLGPGSRVVGPSLIMMLLALALQLDAQGTIAPTNDLPNPYRTVTAWAVLPDTRAWGSTSAVDIARDGTSIWVAERCGANNCAGSTLDPVLQFDSTGKLVRQFGAGLLISPHGIAVDHREAPAKNVATM